MTGPDLRSPAFRVLSALAVRENRSARGNMAPIAKAFHNQRPQAIAATGFPQPAATGHCSHKLPQPARAPRRAADRMDPAAMPRSSKAIRKAATYRDHRRCRRRLHPLPFSLKAATGPAHLCCPQRDTRPRSWAQAFPQRETRPRQACFHASSSSSFWRGCPR